MGRFNNVNKMILDLLFRTSTKAQIEADMDFNFKLST